MMTRKDWMKLIQQGFEHAIHLGTELAIFHVVGTEQFDGSPGPNHQVYATMFTGDSEEEADRQKLAFTQMVHVCCCASRAEGVFFMSEAWMASIRPDELDEDGNYRKDIEYVRPVDRDDRREMIFCVARHKVHGSVMLTSEIWRSERSDGISYDDPMINIIPNIKSRFTVVLDYPEDEVHVQVAKMLARAAHQGMSLGGGRMIQVDGR